MFDEKWEPLVRLLPSERRLVVSTEALRSPLGTAAPNLQAHFQRSPMVEQIKMGTILIEEGVVFPDSLRVESVPYLNGWRVVKGLDGYGLDRKMSEAGWTCFYMADELKGSAVALDGEKSLSKAVSQILTKLKLERFNSLEITEVGTKRFLGLPQTMITAHARHIQESMFLFDWMKKQQEQQVAAPSDKRTASCDAP